MIRGILLFAALALPPMAWAQGAKVFAAESLRPVLEEASSAFSAYRAGAVTFEFGPSEVLRDRLVKGEAADMFVSDDRQNPEAVAKARKAQPAKMYARNHGLVVMNGASPTGHAFANFLLGPEGRRILAARGLAPP